MTRQRRGRAWAVSVVASVSLVLAAFAVDWARTARASDLCAEKELLLVELTAVRTDLKEVTAEANRVLLHIARAKALRGKRAWSGLVALIGECMPQGCWLSSIATDPDRPAAGSTRPTASSKIAGKKKPQGPVTIDAPRMLKIAGFAPDSAQPLEFVTDLKRSEAFTTVSLQSSQRVPVLDGSYYRFELVCTW